MKKLLIDMDYIKYTIAAAGEKRTVDVVHKPTGKIKNFPTRTDFYGHWKKKDAGWLAETNLSRMQDGKKPFAVEEFDFIDKQEAEPLEFALSSVKNHIKNMVEKLDVDEYYGYIGKGDSWRVEASTIVKYKGSRSSLIKPVHLEEVEKYLITSHNGIIKRDLEADDWCVIDCTKNPDLILGGVDKDYFGNNLKFYIHGQMDEPQQISGFGNLYLNDKGAVKGHGYIWWLHQVCSGDDSDEYWANSACPEKRWGEKSSYKALKDCKNEREAWEAAIKVYKKLYPEPRVIKGWRGDEFEVDAKYVLNENCIMSRMMTSEDYKFNLDEELDKWGLKL
jgi:hypothetical protein